MWLQCHDILQNHWQLAGVECFFLCALHPWCTNCMHIAWLESSQGSMDFLSTCRNLWWHRCIRNMRWDAMVDHAQSQLHSSRGKVWQTTSCRFRKENCMFWPTENHLFPSSPSPSSPSALSSPSSPSSFSSPSALSSLCSPSSPSALSSPCPHPSFILPFLFLLSYLLVCVYMSFLLVSFPSFLPYTYYYVFLFTHLIIY